MTDYRDPLLQSKLSSEAVAAQPTLAPASACPSDQKSSYLGSARGLSIASLVLGIASMPLACFILGTIGLILARYALKATPRGANNRFARVGMICSIIGITISALLICVVIGYFAYQIYLSNRLVAF